MSRTRTDALAALTVAATLTALAAPTGPGRSVSYSVRTMGTTAQVVLVTADSVASAPAAAAAHACFRHVDSLMSNWTQTSEVARINREAAKRAIAIHPEVAFVVGEALRVGDETDGALDLTVEPLVRAWGFLGGPRRVPSDEEAARAFALVGRSNLVFDSKAGTIAFKKEGVKIDLGSIAKGYAVDLAADSLRVRGVTDALVDVSGNMRPLGHPPGAATWRIGIRDPRDRMPYFARLELRSDAIATSGKYEQFVAAGGKTYGHIMDPRTGRPAEHGLISVTIVAPTAMEADAWDTPLFVLGPADARRTASRRSDIAAVLVGSGTAGVDTVWVEGALRDRFTLEPGADRLFRVVFF